MAQKVRTFLWYDGKAVEAAKFYTSIFKKSKMIDCNDMSATFSLDGTEFIAFNGGPHFKFTPATSLFITVKTQAEIDHFWKKLSAGGKPQQCGWVQDKFGLCWQVVPDCLQDMLMDNNEAKASRAMDAMLKMKKLDIAKLKKAHAGK